MRVVIFYKHMKVKCKRILETLVLIEKMISTLKKKEWGIKGIIGNGYFTIDKRKGVIAFSSNVGGRLIVMEYVSDGLEYDSTEISIHKFAEKALYDYVKLELLRNKYGIQEYVIRRNEKDYNTSLRNATIRLQEIRLHEAIFMLNGRKKWLK